MLALILSVLLSMQGVCPSVLPGEIPKDITTCPLPPEKP